MGEVKCDNCQTGNVDSRVHIERIAIADSMAFKEITKIFCSTCKSWFIARTKTIDLSNLSGFERISEDMGDLNL